MIPDPQPSLTVVIVAHDRYASIRLAIAHLARQTIADAIEVLIAAPGRDGLGLVEADMAPFLAHRVVEVGEVVFRGRAAAPAVRQAAAPIVVLLENHSFPDPGWAAALVDAHHGPWAGVGPDVALFNPATATARAMHILTYGHASGHQEPVEIAELPWHNSAYKRPLLDGRDDLADLLEWEHLLQDRLRDEGHRLLLDPRATTRHISDSRPSVALRTAFNHGRLFAATRAREWSAARRLGYVVAAPLFPALRLAGLRHAIARVRRRQRVLDALPVLAAFLVAMAAGECVGYLLGDGGVREALARHELDTPGRIRPAERRALQSRLTDDATAPDPNGD